MRHRIVPRAILILCIGVRSLGAQHAGHGMGRMQGDSGLRMTHAMVQAIPLVTRADPTVNGATSTQAALTQVFAMLHVGSAAWTLDATLNGEGLTMRDGELDTGALGEGFIDKRHPHTFLHEVMLSYLASAGPLRVSASAGRGFAAFGTDDPMMRPLVKYPLDHHLSQILERAVATASARAGLVALEASIFDGDEPQSPGSVPSFRRFGDSWSARTTWFAAPRTEVQASYARVASPEERSGFGLDQRKSSASVRHTSGDDRRYVLASWARTTERDHSRNLDVFTYDGALVETSAAVGSIRPALRIERTERPEEERLADPFRTPLPGSDLSIGGITRWLVATLHVDAPASMWGPLLGVPFAEVARLHATPMNDNSLLTPQRLYGTSNFWMLTAGVRVRAGAAHERMGRYGVALP